MNIIGKIKKIEYKPFLGKELIEINLKDFNINSSPTSSLINDNKKTYAISRWVSPKRTRSYPYERVYNTLNYSKKITIIPVVKDEGADGDRDYLNWDSISLMSLLDVFVILAYYETAEKRGNKITNQKFNNNFVIKKIKDIENFHSSALHWNLNELTENLPDILKKAKKSYEKIENNTGVKLHGFDGLEKFQKQIGENVSLFMKFSREKARKAQARESSTIQPKEKLSTLSKNDITIENYLGGKYFFTIDEKEIFENNITLIESKYCKKSIIPSLNDIKDGLLKMILFSNLSEVEVDGIKFNKTVILNLTSEKLKDKISSKDSKNVINDFYKNNNFNIDKIGIINKLFKEANKNHFIVRLGGIK